MESWMISLGITVVGLISGYSIMKHQVSQHAEDLRTVKIEFKEISKNIKDSHDDSEARINAAFRRIDEVSNKVIVLEQNTKEHLGLREAEGHFVTQKELQLHIKVIENSIKHLEKESGDQTKKLDSIILMLSNTKETK